MATTTEIEPQTPVLMPPPAPKRAHVRTGKKPTGRPASSDPEDDDDDATGAEMADAAVNDSGDIWIHLLNLTEDEWSRRLAYLIRLAPTREKRSGGRGTAIATYACRFDRDKIKKEHGSGVYRLDLLVQNQHTGKYSRYRQERFDIEDFEYPPNMPYGTWVNEPENAAWAWAGPKLAAREAAGAVPGVTVAGYPPGFNVSQIMDKADERALRMVEIMTPKENGNLETVLATMIQMNSPERLIALVQAIAPKQDSSMALIVELLRADLKSKDEELRMIREKLFNAPPQKSIIEQFIEIQPQIKGLVEGFAARTGKTDIWAEIAKEGVSQIPDVVSLIRDMVNKKPDAQQHNGMGHHQPAAAMAAAPSTAAATSEPPAKPIADMTEEEKRAYVDHLWKKWGGRLLQVSTHLVEEFTIQDNGYSFRDWYVGMYGKLNWSELKRDLDPELMANMYLAHEQLRKALSPPMRLVVFLREFVTDFEAEDDTPLDEKLAAAAKTGAVEKSQPEPAAAQSEGKA